MQGEAARRRPDRRRARDASGCSSPSGSCRRRSRSTATRSTTRSSPSRSSCAIAIAERPTVFVTKDTNLRIRADALGLHAEDYDVEGVELDELWSGVAELEVAPEEVNDFYAGGALSWQPEGEPPPPNEFVVLRDRANPAAHRGRQVQRAEAGVRAAHQDAEGGRLGHPAAQQGAVLRARSAAQRRHPARHARRQGGHRQDAPRDRRRAAEDDRGGRLPEAARLAAHLPARARHRLPAGRRRGEAQPLDAADLRQPRVPHEPVALRQEGRARLPRAPRPRHPGDRAAHVHPRPLASRTSSSSWTRRRTSRRTR